MEHKLFKIISLISLILITAVASLYNYYILTYPSILFIRFILKPIPVIILTIQISTYFCIYRLNFYAFCMFIFMLFCFMGDIMIMFYIPDKLEYDHKSFLIVGGASFLIARMVISISFIVYPYIESINKRISFPLRKTIIIGVISFLFTGTLIVYFIIYIDSILFRIFLPIYVVSMGTQLFFSLMRIGGFQEESLIPQIFSVIGTILFNISDIILFINMFLFTIDFGENVAICLYWVAMYILTISIVRNKCGCIEKNSTSYLPLA